MNPNQYFKHHVFVCLNQRPNGEACCANHDAQAAFTYLKEQVKACGLAGSGQVRINKAGCLDRCDQGPVMVVYPEGTWYTFVDNEDLDDIIESHLKQGKPVDRLMV